MLYVVSSEALARVGVISSGIGLSEIFVRGLIQTGPVILSSYLGIYYQKSSFDLKEHNGM